MTTNPLQENRLQQLWHYCLKDIEAKHGSKSLLEFLALLTAPENQTRIKTLTDDPSDSSAMLLSILEHPEPQNDLLGLSAFVDKAYEPLSSTFLKDHLQQTLRARSCNQIEHLPQQDQKAITYLQHPDFQLLIQKNPICAALLCNANGQRLRDLLDQHHLLTLIHQHPLVLLDFLWQKTSAFRHCLNLFNHEILRNAFAINPGLLAPTIKLSQQDALNKLLRALSESSLHTLICQHPSLINLFYKINNDDRCTNLAKVMQSTDCLTFFKEKPDLAACFCDSWNAVHIAERLQYPHARQFIIKDPVVGSMLIEMKDIYFQRFHMLMSQEAARQVTLTHTDFAIHIMFMNDDRHFDNAFELLKTHYQPLILACPSLWLSLVHAKPNFRQDLEKYWQAHPISYDFVVKHIHDLQPYLRSAHFLLDFNHLLELISNEKVCHWLATHTSSFNLVLPAGLKNPEKMAYMLQNQRFRELIFMHPNFTKELLTLSEAQLQILQDIPQTHQNCVLENKDLYCALITLREKCALQKFKTIFGSTVSTDCLMRISHHDISCWLLGIKPTPDAHHRQIRNTQETYSPR